MYLNVDFAMAPIQLVKKICVINPKMLFILNPFLILIIIIILTIIIIVIVIMITIIIIIISIIIIIIHILLIVIIIIIIIIMILNNAQRKLYLAVCRLKCSFIMSQQRPLFSRKVM